MYGMTLDQYCQYMGITLEKFRENIRPQAELNIKRDLVLEAVAAAEEIAVTEEEFEQEFEKAAEYLKKPVDEVKDMFKDRRGDIENEIKQRKAVDLIFETAVKVKAKEDKESEEKAPAKKKASAKKAAEKKDEENA